MKKFLFNVFYLILVREEFDSVLGKKEKHNQVKVIWITPSSGAKKLSFFETELYFFSISIQEFLCVSTLSFLLRSKK
jgi:hypothetical protein